MQEQEKKQETKQEAKKKLSKVSCADKQCPVHGKLKLHGRSFKGLVKSKHLRRVAIEFKRTVYLKKYERYMKKKTRVHARLPDCLKDKIEIGDHIEVRECRPLSKIIHFAVVGKLGGKK